MEFAAAVSSSVPTAAVLATSGAPKGRLTTCPRQMNATNVIAGVKVIHERRNGIDPPLVAVMTRRKRSREVSSGDAVGLLQHRAEVPDGIGGAQAGATCAL